MAEGFNLIFTKANFLFMMNGLLMTILISIGTIFLSMIFGTILALLRHFCTGKWAWLSGLTGVYIEFFRCTPNILWILWIRFTIKGNPLVLAIFACTLFTTAVMAEIIRGGIMSIDPGQMEAGRSLGFGYVATMRHIILPQAFKNVLPTLANEFIVLLKETAVAGYVGLNDLTYVGNIIGGNAYDYLFPLLISALVYLTLVMFFTFLVGKLERRLRNSER